MKKNIKYIAFAAVMFFTITLTVLAEDANLNLESDPNVINVFKIGGYALFIVKIFVPILLMIFASIDMFKAVISSDQDMIKKQTQVIIKRGIASIVIFLLPSLIYFAFTVLVNFDGDLQKYDKLGQCLRSPGTCETKTSP